MIEILPDNAQSHNKCFARACCHLEGIKRILVIRRVITLNRSCTKIPCHVYEVSFFHYFININQRLNSFSLAEPKLERFIIRNMIFIKPELQKPFCGWSGTIIIFSPGKYCFAKLINQVGFAWTALCKVNNVEWFHN